MNEARYRGGDTWLVAAGVSIVLTAIALLGSVPLTIAAGVAIVAVSRARRSWRSSNRKTAG